MAAKYILIADPDQKTLVKLEEALRDLDVHVSVAADGAQALERALTVRQDLFLFSDRLPIIDTPKLAEILRANPRTANVALVLLRHEEGSAAYGDGSLSRPIQREALVNLVLRHAFKVGTLQESGEKLSGLLSEIPVPDLLQIMRANRREGTLEIAGTPSGSIWVRRGEIIDARAGKAEGMKAFIRLLEAKEGKFTFKAGKVARTQTLELPLEGLLLEAARQRDEVERLRIAKPLHGRLVLLREITALPEGLHPVHRELLLLVEFYGNVEDVVENARVTEMEAQVGLRSLIDASIIGASNNEGRDNSAGFRVEPALMMNLKQLAGHSPRRVRPIRIAVFVSASSVISEVNDILQPAKWGRNQDRVLGNRIVHALDGEFTLQVDFFPPGRDFAPLLTLPTGLLVGGLVLSTANDDKELDYLNESAALLQAEGLPVEYAFHGDGDLAWARQAFDVPASAVVHRVQRGGFSPLNEALRSILIRRAAAAGWSVTSR